LLGAALIRKFIDSKSAHQQQRRSKMELVQETVSLPKESKEIKDCVVDIIVKLKGGAKVTDLVVEEFPALQRAVTGYAALPEEMKSKEEVVLAGLMAGQIVAALKG
jgi:hypothetical protein